MYPIINGFKSTSIRNAFILNSMLAAFTAIIAIKLTERVEQNK